VPRSGKAGRKTGTGLAEGLTNRGFKKECAASPYACCSARVRAGDGGRAADVTVTAVVDPPWSPSGEVTLVIACRKVGKSSTPNCRARQLHRISAGTSQSFSFGTEGQVRRCSSSTCSFRRTRDVHDRAIRFRAGDKVTRPIGDDRSGRIAEPDADSGVHGEGRPMRKRTAISYADRRQRHVYSTTGAWTSVLHDGRLGLLRTPSTLAAGRGVMARSCRRRKAVRQFRDGSTRERSQTAFFASAQGRYTIAARSIS